jgi:iron complex transport system substrate-binding protein
LPAGLLRGVRRIFAVVVTCGLLVVTACAGGEDSTAGSTASNFPMTLKNCGRELTFDKVPERILSIGGEAATLLAAAGANDKISSLALLEGVPLGAAESVVKDTEQLGNPRDLSPEVILGRQPDVIVSDSTIAETMPIEDLAAAGIETLIVSGYCENVGLSVEGDPSVFELIYNDIETYGKLFGTQDIAAKAVTDLRERVAAVEKQVAGISGASTAALYMYAEKPLGAYGNKAVVDDQMKILRLNNVFGDVEKRYFEPTVEEIIARNPEQVIALFIPGQSELPTPESAVQELHSRGELANVEAIRKDAIFPLNYYYSGPGTLAVEGLELLAEQLVKAN